MANKEELLSSLSSTLVERGSRYGKFIDHALISQELVRVLERGNSWDALWVDQKEALEMIMHKIARILNGDPDYADSWHDIAGYATLVEQRLNGEKNNVDYTNTEPVQVGLDFSDGDW